MNIFPAIDLYGGKAVRLYKGNYDEMTVYSDDPLKIAQDFASQGAKYLHVVDLEGAKTGLTPNIDTVTALAEKSGLFTEVGGGIRSLETIKKYIDHGVDRVILGTAAVTDGELLERAVAEYGERIAVGVDIRDGFVAIRGWTVSSDLEAISFCRRLQKLGVKTVICTDISKDGAMQGTNHALYRTLAGEIEIDVIASGGVSSLDDVRRLASLGLYGAIIGKAYYTGAISIRDAIAAADRSGKGI